MIVVIMNRYVATLIKVGNSYALRVPKRYVDDANLTLGQKATISLPLPIVKQDRTKIQGILKQLNKTKAYSQITNPVDWQRKGRTDRSLPGRG